MSDLAIRVFVSCRRVSWLCSLDRDESEIHRVVGATYSLRHERRPPAMLRVLDQAGWLSLSVLPAPTNDLYSVLLLFLILVVVI